MRAQVPCPHEAKEWHVWPYTLERIPLAALLRMHHRRACAGAGTHDRQNAAICTRSGGDCQGSWREAAMKGSN